MLAPQIHQNPKKNDPKRYQKIDRFSGRSFWPCWLHLSPQVPPTWPSLAPSWAPRPANLGPKRPQIVRFPDLFFDFGADMAPKTAQNRFWTKFGLILDEIWSDFRLKFQQIFAHVGQKPIRFWMTMFPFGRKAAAYLTLSKPFISLYFIIM